jgi:hypothetical protein
MLVSFSLDMGRATVAQKGQAIGDGVKGMQKNEFETEYL